MDTDNNGERGCESISEWISKIPDELEIDAVGLWQFYPMLADTFGLTKEEAKPYMRETIELLITCGAWPVDGTTGEVRSDLFSENKPSVDKIMVYIDNLDHDPSFEDIWFDAHGHFAAIQ